MEKKNLLLGVSLILVLCASSMVSVRGLTDRQAPGHPCEDVMAYWDHYALNETPWTEVIPGHMHALIVYNASHLLIRLYVHDATTPLSLENDFTRMYLDLRPNGEDTLTEASVRIDMFRDTDYFCRLTYYSGGSYYWQGIKSYPEWLVCSISASSVHWEMKLRIHYTDWCVDELPGTAGVLIELLDYDTVYKMPFWYEFPNGSDYHRWNWGEIAFLTEEPPDNPSDDPWYANLDWRWVIGGLICAVIGVTIVAMVLKRRSVEASYKKKRENRYRIK